MMKRYICLLLLTICVAGAMAQDMKTVFTSMPDARIPLLEEAWRKDLIALYESGKESGKKAALKNMMDGNSSLEKLTDDYLLIQLTEQSTVEMKLLPLVNNTHIVCVITTVNGPVPDSRLEFYTTEWQPLAAADLIDPVSTEWFISETADKNNFDYQELIGRMDMDLIRYSLSPDDLSLTAIYTTPSYLNKEEQNKISSFLKKDPKTYLWNKHQFK